MASAQDSIGIYWFEGTRRWQIFGLIPDRLSYWGEHIDLGSREGFKMLEGTVSPEDFLRIASLVGKIKALPSRTESESPISGLLYEGRRSCPHILFRRLDNEPAPAHDQLFAEIVEVMKKYV